ncbi:uncharacterized protein [Haliotis cracherodii]|uniref:uncharacterized protein n=1 Tax=Haliotis cracherodii TaxID=6455 RepID=UPI0039E8513A
MEKMLRWMVRRFRAKRILSLLILMAAVIFLRNKIKAYGPYAYEDTLAKRAHLADEQWKTESVLLKEVNFNVMLRDYEKKIKDLQTSGLWKMNDVKPCAKEKRGGRACIEPSCPEPKPAQPEENLKSVLSTMSGLNHEDLRVLMRLFPEPPTDRRAMFVTASSSNHYNESQGLIRNLQQNVFPLINNYTFVIYDLGLLPWQRQQLQKHCHCELRNFPLKFLPSRLQNLKCYTWKPMIVQANLPKADILVWMDASVRFSNNIIKPLLDDVERRGIVIYPGARHEGDKEVLVSLESAYCG